MSRLDEVESRFRLVQRVSGNCPEIYRLVWRLRAYPSPDRVGGDWLIFFERETRSGTETEHSPVATYLDQRFWPVELLVEEKATTVLPAVVPEAIPFVLGVPEQLFLSQRLFISSLYRLDVETRRVLPLASLVNYLKSPASSPKAEQ